MSNDSALIEAAREGDQRALVRLLECSQPDLKRIAASQCASAADADDAVQESLLQVYRRIGALRTVGSYAAWMFSIVRHECQRLMRKVRGQVELPDDDANPLFAYYTTPGLRIDLAAAIQSLPDKYREAIVLRDFEEYSITEIAEALRLTREAVKSRIHRGREMIREYLRD
jgi:RNA polymerase sigma factor (sigma-70 family)